MSRQVVDINNLLLFNEDLRKAYQRGDKWAVDHINKSQRLNDGDAHAFTRNFDGQSRNWCSNCPSPHGCVVCTLDPPRTRAEVVQPFDDSGYDGEHGYPRGSPTERIKKR